MTRTSRALGAALLAIFGLGGVASAEVPESKEPIKLTLHDWTGQLVTTEIMGRVLQSMGYNVEYVQADYLAQFAGLESGDLHVAMEMWETTGKDAMEASLATGKTVDLGETGMQAKEEWWYPLYMKEQVPGPARLAGAQRLRRGLRDARDGAERALSRRPGDLGRLRRRAGRGAGPRLRRGPRRHRRRAVRRARIGLPARGAVARLDLHAALGADQVRGRMGRVPGRTRTPATRTRPGARTPTSPTTAASLSAGSRRSAGRRARINGPAPTTRSATSRSTTRPWAA